MKKIFLFFAFLLSLLLYLGDSSYAQTKIDWKQIKNIPDTLEFKNVLLEHLFFKSAYQPVIDYIHQGAMYYDNQLERLRVYEHGEWRDLTAVTIASDSIGAPLTILGYLQATDIYASRSAYIGKDVNVKGNVNASGTSTFNYLKVNNALKVPTVASKTLGVGSIYYDTTAKKLKVLNSSNNWDIVSVDVDSALSATSTNPVQNKAIYTKFDNFNASVTQSLEQALIDAYNYTNAVATQTKNYADNAANNASDSAYNAAVAYANTQIMVIDGRINTLNTNLLASLTQGLTGANASATLYASSAVQISEGYAQGLATATYNAAASYTDALRTYVDTQDRLTMASATNNAIASATELFVSDVYTGVTSGTIKVLKNNQLTEVAVQGLGDAAFTSVASISSTISSTISGNVPSHITPPSNPSPGQMYFDPASGTIKFWTGSEWYAIVTPTVNSYDTTNKVGYREYSDGWMECWGQHTVTNLGGSELINFPNGGFKNTQYSISIVGDTMSNNPEIYYATVTSKAKASVTINSFYPIVYWYASGFKN